MFRSSIDKFLSITKENLHFIVSNSQSCFKESISIEYIKKFSFPTERLYYLLRAIKLKNWGITIWIHRYSEADRTELVMDIVLFKCFSLKNICVYMWNIASWTAYRVGQKFYKLCKSKVNLFQEIQQNVIQKNCFEFQIMPIYQYLSSQQFPNFFVYFHNTFAMSSKSYTSDFIQRYYKQLIKEFYQAEILQR